MNAWDIAVSNGEPRLRVYNHGIISQAKLALELAVDKIDVFTGHAFCGAGVEWPWKIPLGKPKRAHDGFLENSLGNLLYNTHSAFLIRIMDDLEKDLIHELPLTREEALRLQPSLKETFEIFDETS